MVEIIDTVEWYTSYVLEPGDIMRITAYHKYTGECKVVRVPVSESPVW